MANKDVLLSVKNLTVEYTSEGEVIHAVNNVSFELEKGKTIGLVGETGAGKTSIARAILRILPEPPARVPNGEIEFEGKDLLKIREEDMQKIRGNEISMIFQDPMTALNPLMTVGDQILEVLQLHNDYDQKTGMRKAGEMLETVGIPAERYSEYPHQFSGGMKQRVVIAMALACNPELLLADEPTTALDVTIQAQVLDLINELKEKFQTSMILITHDLGVIAQTCETVAVIYAGSIVESGTKEDIFDHPTHPYTIGLFDSLPNMTAEGEKLKPIAGMPPDPTNLPAGCPFAPRCPFATEKCHQQKPEAAELSPGHWCACFNKTTPGTRKEEA